MSGEENNNWPKLPTLALFLAGYALLHYLIFHGFYWGFLGSYERLSQLFDHYLSIAIPGMNHIPFHGFSLILSGLSHPISAIVFVLFLFPLIWYWKKLSWNRFGYQCYLKTIVLVAAFVLCWELVTYDYNYYLDTGFNIDRILLFLLLVGIWFHPIFASFFAVAALVYRAQFNYPIDGFVLLDKQVLFDALILFTCFLWFRIIRALPSSFYLWVLLCLMGSNYFYPLLGKLFISPHGYEW
jgi:hypothetical protein